MIKKSFTSPLALSHNPLHKLALLASLSLPASHVTADETIKDFDNPDAFAGALLPNSALCKDERTNLLQMINASCLRLFPDSKSAEDLDILPSLVKRYSNALLSANDLSEEEIRYAQQLITSNARVVGHHNYMFNKQYEEIVWSQMLILNSALIDRLQLEPPSDMPKDAANSCLEALMRNLIAPSYYKNTALLDEGCRMFARRIFTGSDVDYEKRLILFSKVVKDYPASASNPSLLVTLVDSLDSYFATNNPDPAVMESINRLGQNLSLNCEDQSILPIKIKERLANPEINRSVLCTLGNFLGAACLFENSKTWQGFRNYAVFKTDNPDKGLEILSKAAERHSEALPFTTALLQHLLYENQGVQLGAIDKIRSSEDRESFKAHKLNSLYVAAGILAQIDCVLNSTSGFNPGNEYQNLASATYKSPLIPSDLPNCKQLSKLREQYRTSLGTLAYEGWSEKQRAEVFTLLISLDHSRFNKIQESELYINYRLTELAAHFPMLSEANRKDRYSSKIGGIKYVPPVLAKGPPAPYADSYFYLRYALESNLKDNKNVNALVRDYMQASQELFLYDLITTLWGNSKNERIIEIHRGYTDSRMVEETLKIITQFRMYRHDVELRMKLENVEKQGFISHISKLKFETSQKRDNLDNKLRELMLLAGILRP